LDGCGASGNIGICGLSHQLRLIHHVEPTYTLDNFGFIGIAVDVGPIRLGEWR
jgi:hypothetical protein